MSKFNWNRFYDELDEANPREFPYWMFFFHSLGDMVSGVVQGLVVGFMILTVGFASIGIWSAMLKSHPEYAVEMICSSYNSAENNGK